MKSVLIDKERFLGLVRNLLRYFADADGISKKASEALISTIEDKIFEECEIKPSKELEVLIRDLDGLRGDKFKELSIEDRVNMLWDSVCTVLATQGHCVYEGMFTEGFQQLNERLSELENESFFDKFLRWVKNCFK